MGRRPDRVGPGIGGTSAADAGSGPYQLQAAIAALHAGAECRGNGLAASCRPVWRVSPDEPLPVVRLNQAVAIAMSDGIDAGLTAIDPIADQLNHYHLMHAARADLLRRLGRWATRRLQSRD